MTVIKRWLTLVLFSPEFTWSLLQMFMVMTLRKLFYLLNMTYCHLLTFSRTWPNFTVTVIVNEKHYMYCRTSILLSTILWLRLYFGLYYSSVLGSGVYKCVLDIRINIIFSLYNQSSFLFFPNNVRFQLYLIWICK